MQFPYSNLTSWRVDRLDLISGEFIKKDARIEDYDLGKLVYELIVDGFTGYVRISSIDGDFVDRYLLLEDGKIIGSSEESRDRVITGIEACKNFLKCKKGWFDICALQPHEMSIVKRWNEEVLFTMKKDVNDITTELEEGRGIIIDTWGDGVLAMDSSGGLYFLLDRDRRKPEEKAEIDEKFGITIEMEKDPCVVGETASFSILAESKKEEIFDLEIRITIDGEEQETFFRMIEAGKLQKIEFIPEKPGDGEILVIASPIESDEKYEWRRSFKVEEKPSETVDDLQDLKVDLDIESLKEVIETEGLGHMIVRRAPDASNPEEMDKIEEIDPKKLSEIISEEIQSFGKKNRVKILNSSVVINGTVNVYVWYEFGILSKLKHLNDVELSVLLEKDISTRLESSNIRTLPVKVETKSGKKNEFGKLANAFDF
ncbi:MAG: hypothetical protein ACXQS7_01595 [Candidatus Syntropharchaeia archaeon]